MKSKLAVLILLVAAIFVGIKVNRIINGEMIEKQEFTDFYEDNVTDNGGWLLQQENFYIFRRNFDIGLKKEIDENKIPEKFEYIVKEGDTLSEIAEAHNMGLSVLLANNPGVTAKNLKIGQKLTLLTGNGIFYKVVKGDNLSKIANLFKVDVEEIKTINKLENNEIQIGDILYIKNPNLSRYLNNKKPGVINTSELGFTMPIKYTGITSPYGNRFHPVLKRYIFHSGVDLKAHFIPVYASKEGTVTFAGTMNGYGKIIIIKHTNGYETRYAHLDKIGVSKGQYVQTGELLGKSGKSGRVTGPHLHFELRKNGATLNPMKYVPTK